MLSPALSSLVWLAFLVEFLTETVQENFPHADRLPAGIIALVFGIGLCFLTETGLLNISGDAIRSPAVDYIITGLIVSRGSGVVHDFISALRGFARSYARRL